MNPDVQAVLRGERQWAVVCGERDTVLASLDDSTIDVTLTDPPYNERTHKGARVKGAGLQSETTVRFAALDSFGWWRESLRVARRWCLAFCAAEHLGAYETAAPKAWVRAGIWVKPGAPPQFTGDRPGTGAEAVAIAHRAGRKRWNGGGKVAIWTHGFARGEVGAARMHETQKPLAIMRELVRDFSDPGEVIADWHAGSGTTGVAALMEGRRVILVERDPEHAATCRRRLEETEVGTGTRRAKQLSLLSAGGAR